jgi:hypothetical protein
METVEGQMENLDTSASQSQMKKEKQERGKLRAVAHACNLSYSRGREGRMEVGGQLWQS